MEEAHLIHLDPIVDTILRDDKRRRNRVIPLIRELGADVQDSRLRAIIDT